MSESKDTLPTSPLVAQAFSDIAENLINDVPALPAVVFKEHILQPLLDGNREKFINNWSAVAGTVQRDIRVMNDKNEELARAPSLMASTMTQFAPNHAESLGEIAFQAQRRGEVAPRMADVYLQDRLAKRNIGTEGTVGIMRSWNRLATLLESETMPFPGLEEKIQPIDSAPTTSSPVFSDQDDDF